MLAVVLRAHEVACCAASTRPGSVATIAASPRPGSRRCPRARGRIARPRCGVSVSASISWTVMRTRRPTLRTLPSTTYCDAELLRDLLHLRPPCPCNLNEELREITNSSRKRDSSVMMSSVMPSAKNSCSGSPLMLSNGRTAIDGLMTLRRAAPLPAAGAASSSIARQTRTGREISSVTSRPDLRT